ncbi:MAG: hypothetical protein JKY95_20075, partial [Planctomycetaceae bacterium]|nr:hypothetical protein [Planctomycetaceae bacterium]
THRPTNRTSPIPAATYSEPAAPVPSAVKPSAPRPAPANPKLVAPPKPKAVEPLKVVPPQAAAEKKDNQARITIHVPADAVVSGFLYLLL